jgi:hypothetical protein
LTAAGLLLNLHHSTSALLKYADRNGSVLFNWISGGVSKSSGSNEYSHPIQGTFSYSVESGAGRFYISGTTIDLFLYERTWIHKLKQDFRSKISKEPLNMVEYNPIP